MSASILPGSFFFWPLHVVQAAGQNANLVLLLALVWGVLVAILSGPMPRTQWMNRVITGCDLASLMAVMAVDVVLMNQLSSMLQTFFYFDTPRAALLVPLLGVVGLGVLRSPETVWRLAALWMPVLFLPSTVIGSLALVNVHHIRQLLPNSVIALHPLVRGMAMLAYLAIPLGMTLRRVLPRMAKHPGVRARTVAVLGPWLFLAIFYLVVVGSLGPQAMTQLRWPVVFALDHVTLDSTFFLSRIGMVVVFSWTVGVAIGLMVHLRLLLTVPPCSSLLPQRHWLILGILVFWGGLALAIPSPDQSSRLLLHWFNPAIGVYLIVELLGMLSLAYYTRHRRKPP